MRHALLVVALLITGLAGRRPAAASPNGCCACLAGNPHAMSAQAGPAERVLFCGFVTPTTSENFIQNCENAGGNSAACAAPSTNQTCPEVLLAGEGVTCPPPSPTPVAGEWSLTALALVLSAFGIAAKRRRAH